MIKLILIPCKTCGSEAEWYLENSQIPPSKAIVKCSNSNCSNNMEVLFNHEKEEDLQMALSQVGDRWNIHNAPNPMQKQIDELQGMKTTFNTNLEEKIKNDEKIKDGTYTAEDEKAEPGNLLFNAISEMSINILQDPEIIKSFKLVDEKLTSIALGKNDPNNHKIGEEIMQSIVGVMAITMATSAYNAILFYDDLLKKELTTQFQHHVHNINLCKADIEASRILSEVLKAHINKISDILKIETILDYNKTT